MSKSVIDGELLTISPSSISKFDPAQPFGCNRKWWFRYVAGLPEPQTGSQALGDALHKLIEHRLVHGQAPQAEGDAAGLYVAGSHIIEMVAQRRILGVEAPVNLEIEGVKIHPMSKCDVVWEEGIIDWKTSSDIRRYGKSAGDLMVDTQLGIYARAFHPTRESVFLAHGKFQTKGAKRADFTEVEVTREELDYNFENVIIPLVRQMKDVAKEVDSKKVTPNFSKCFNCAFREKCPTEEGNPVMAFFKKTPAAPVAPAAEVTPHDVVDNPAYSKSEQARAAKAIAGGPAVLPPDAPASKPELAAKPVEGFSAIPPPKERKVNFIDDPAPEEQPDMTPEEVARAQETDAAVAADKAKAPTAREVMVAANAAMEPGEPSAPAKRGPGRPKGSPNKPKPSEVAQHGSVSFKTISVSHGATINLGNYNSARVEVTIGAEISGDPDAAYRIVSEAVQRALDAEAARYEGSVVIKQDSKGNATELGTRAQAAQGGGK